MGDRERENGKQKRTEYEEFGESSEGSARRATESPGGQNGVGGNPSPPPLDLRDGRSCIWPRPQQRPAALRGGEEGCRGGLQTQEFISQIDCSRNLSWMQDPGVMGSPLAAWSDAQHQESSGAGNPDGGNRTSSPGPQQQPAAQGAGDEGDPVKLQMQYSINRVPRMMEFLRAFQAALKIDEEEEQGSGDVRNPDTLMPPAWARTPSPSSQFNFAWDSTQTEAQPAATVGQNGAATGASGSGQPQPPADAEQQFSGDPWELQMQYSISQFPRMMDNLRARLAALSDDEEEEQGSGDMRNPDTLMPPAWARMPPAWARTPSPSSQMNFAWDSTQTEAQPAATAGQNGAATGASGSGQPQPPADAGQQFSGNLFSHWMPSANARWQVSEDQMCPGCNYFSGRLDTHPPQHVCLCLVCYELAYSCPTCVLSRQPLRKDES